MNIDKLAKKGRIAELSGELKKLSTLVDDEMLALKAQMLPSYEAWEYDPDALELRFKELVSHIRKAREIKAKLSELEQNG